MSEFRNYAKATAIFDLVLCALLMLLLIGIVVAVVVISESDQTQQSSEADDPAADLENDYIWIFWVSVAICAILIAVRTWAAVQLLSATQIGREPVEALRLASSWWYVSIAFIGLEIIGFLIFLTTEMNMNSPVFNLLVVHGVMVYMVFPYMQELEMTSVPVFIIPQK